MWICNNCGDTCNCPAESKKEIHAGWYASYIYCPWCGSEDIEELEEE